MKRLSPLQLVFVPSELRSTSSRVELVSRVTEQISAFELVRGTEIGAAIDDLASKDEQVKYACLSL